MSVEENKRAFYRAFKEIWNKGDYSVIPEVISPDYTNNFGHKGLDEFEQLVKGSRTAFRAISTAVFILSTNSSSLYERDGFSPKANMGLNEKEKVSTPICFKNWTSSAALSEKVSNLADIFMIYSVLTSRS